MQQMHQVATLSTQAAVEIDQPTIPTLRSQQLDNHRRNYFHIFVDQNESEITFPHLT